MFRLVFGAGYLAAPDIGYVGCDAGVLRIKKFVRNRNVLHHGIVRQLTAEMAGVAPKVRTAIGRYVVWNWNGRADPTWSGSRNRRGDSAIGSPGRDEDSHCRRQHRIAASARCNVT